MSTNLPAGEDLRKLVKSWALKKMATQFQTWKKKLYNEFVKKNLTLDFSQNSPYKKLKDDWPEFVRYKTSKEGEEQVRRNQQNARQKVYHDKTGSGGYRSAIPKWQRMKEDLLAKGIHPFSLEWPERSKNCFFAHGDHWTHSLGSRLLVGKSEQQHKDLSIL